MGDESTHLSVQRVLGLLAALLVLRVAGSVVWGYDAYFPPDFSSTFLLGRESYFFGLYGGAFYPHIVAGPISLLFGTLLVSDSFRSRWPRGHRRIGKLQVALVLLVIVPSGLFLSLYADGGPVAVTGFATLALATAACALLGWVTAVRRQFTEHRRWMWRCYLLLCSAVTLRLIGGFVTVTGIGLAGSYPLAAWASWLAPLAIFELAQLLTQRLANPASSLAGLLEVVERRVIISRD